ncbi:TonB family protein [Cellvibrio sp.]
MRIKFAFLFVVLLSCEGFAIEQKKDQLQVAPHASWIIPQALPHVDAIPQDKINSGVYYLLVDEQLRVPRQGKNVFYTHYAKKIVNQSGLQESSQVNINYDPTYQTFIFHSLLIHRDGKLFNALPKIKYSVLQREQELENSLYDGSLTANIIISDLRVGDVVEYSYSITGDNPIHAGAFYYRFYTQWTVSLRQLYFRLFWERENELYVKANNSALKPVIKQLDGAKEFIYQTANTEPLQTNNQTPDWYNPYGRVEISDVAHWADVVVWAQALYDSAIESDGAIDQLVADIQRKHSTKEDQIEAALDAVQSQVRYLGIETGVNSHKPSKAGETWQRRYGDCKDKTVLFISLLRQMGVVAYPALVDTDDKQEIIHRLPAATAFNHVITKVELDGKNYWLDPTRQHQQSRLADIYQPDYGYALVVAPGSASLTKMTHKRISAQIIEEELDLSGAFDKPASYRITTNYKGLQAETQRNKAAETNLRSTSDQYLNFYKGYYSTISSSAPVEYKDYPGESRFQVREAYSIANIWQTSESNLNKKYVSVYASIIETNVLKPDELHRNSPFALRYPDSITQKIQVKVGGDWGFEQETVVEDNEFFHYSSDINFDPEKNVLNLIYKYETKKDHVPAEKINEYASARKKVMDDIGYNVYQPAVTQANNLHYEDYLYWLLFIVFLLLLVLAFIGWYRDKKRREYNLAAVFFPVSILKFIVLSVFTFGIYLSYWFWRNWIYVKRHDNSSILPFARAFFSPFWYYPFYQALISNEQVKNRRYLPASLGLAAALALLFFVANIAANKAPAIYDVAAILVCILLVLPLVIQINKIPQEDASIYLYNSRFRWRHLLVILFFLPFMLLYIGMESGFLANTKVIDGKQLWSYHVKFMQRNGVIEEGETIQRFYSSALLDIRKDGNGFTNTSVFSYWEEEGELQHQSLPLAEVKDIELSSQEAEGSSDAVVKIYPEDDESFILYVSKNADGHKQFYNQLKKNWSMEKVRKELRIAFPLPEDRIKYKKNNIYTMVERLVNLLYENDEFGARSYALATLYESGNSVARNYDRAIYFYNKAYESGHLAAGVRLAWLLSVVDDNELLKPKRAIKIIRAVLKKQNTPANREVLAAAYAANGEFDLGIKTQTDALKDLFGVAAEKAQERLAFYKSNQVWVESSSAHAIATEAMPVIKTPPKYPYKALDEKQEGIVLVQYDVTDSGTTTNIKVVSAEPQGYFEEGAISAAQKFVYIPSIENGVPKATHGVKNRFTFELDD